MLINKKYFKEMSLPKKIKYLLSYYGLAAVGVAALVFIIVYLVKPVFENYKYNAYCLILNDTWNEDLAAHIKKEFPKYLNNDKYLFNVSNDYPFFYLEEEGINWPEDGTNFKLLTCVKTHNCDVMISDYNTMLWTIHQEFIYPIDEILPGELLEKLKPYFVYANFKGNSDGKVYGLNISETEVYKKYSRNYKNAVLLIPNATKRPKVAVEFIKYIYASQ